MSDEAQILSLLNQYCYTVDSGDLDGFAALYEDAELYADGAPRNKGSQDILDNVMSNVIIYEDGTPKTRHMNANVELSIDAVAGTAKAQRYVTVLQQTETLPLQTIFTGHYHDEFVRQDGRWRYAKTVIKNPLVGDTSQHLSSSEFIEAG